jgi:outer membrane protein assembly factor BamB
VYKSQVLSLGIASILGSSGDLDLDDESALLWHNNLNGAGTAPAIGSDGTIYAGSTDNRLRAFNPDGTLKWSYPAGGPIDSSPAIGSDGTIYAGSDDFYLRAINPDGSLKWRYATEGPINSSPAVDCDGILYFGSGDSYLRAINPDGSLKWRYFTGGPIDSSPSVGSDGTVHVGSRDGKLYAINSGNGSLKWSVAFPSDYPVSASPAIGSDGTIYALTRDLRIINADGTVDETITLYRDEEGSSPVIKDGVLYTTTTSILAYEIESDSLADSPWPVFRHDLKHTGRTACDTP